MFTCNNFYIIMYCTSRDVLLPKSLATPANNRINIKILIIIKIIIVLTHDNNSKLYYHLYNLKWLITYEYICTQDSLQHDLVHCNLQPDGDVFFSSSGDVRYSNLKSPLQSGRRHSISSFGNYSSRRPLSDCMAKSSRARLASVGDPKGNYHF